ncbi:MAG TPA: hypothetical protein VGY55_17050 [Pirellulales bacterium]|nr:hypothetical protein [Pirellulales bacterium]
MGFAPPHADRGRKRRPSRCLRLEMLEGRDLLAAGSLLQSWHGGSTMAHAQLVSASSNSIGSTFVPQRQSHVGVQSPATPQGASRFLMHAANWHPPVSGDSPATLEAFTPQYFQGLQGGTLSLGSGSTSLPMGMLVSARTVQGTTLNGGSALNIGGGTLALQPIGGASSLTLVGANTFGGGTTITGGRLQLGGGTNVPISAGLQVPITNTGSTSEQLPILNSAGTLTLTSSTAEDLSFGGYSGSILGAAPGAGPAYSGTLTPNSNSYRLSGGEGTLALSSAATYRASASTLDGNGSLTFSGGAVGGGTFAKSGTGTLEIGGAPSLGSNSGIQVSGGTLRFNTTSGAATIATGVTAPITNGATLELAGSVSDLSAPTTVASRVHVINNSSQAGTGVLVSGTNQQVGAIDGSGTTLLNVGSDLTADHIVQNSLVIGGTATSAGLVTINASDSSGTPLAATLGLSLANSLSPSTPFAAGTLSGSSLLASSGSSSGAI